MSVNVSVRLDDRLAELLLRPREDPTRAVSSPIPALAPVTRAARPLELAGDVLSPGDGLPVAACS